MHLHGSIVQHDQVVKTLVGAFQRESKGGWAVGYNAGKGEDGSTHAMIHERLLRSARQPCNTRGARRDAAEWDEETAELKRLKPNVIIYEGVRQEKLREFQEGTERPCQKCKIHVLQVGYCNDWNWETKLAEHDEAYRCLVARMKKCGWKVEYRQVALGTRGCVYKHLADTLTWLGVKNFNTRKKLAKDIALHGAREASRALRTYEKFERLTRTKQGG